MKQNNVDNFLSYLNQHLSIRFTMETENDNKITSLDSLVTREPDGKLHTSVYRKPTHTDQYLMYDTHHPQSVKRGIVKCLHDRAERIITKPQEQPRRRNINPQFLLPMATLHLACNPNNINRDNGAEIPEAWMLTVRKH